MMAMSGFAPVHRDPPPPDADEIVRSLAVSVTLRAVENYERAQAKNAECGRVLDEPGLDYDFATKLEKWAGVAEYEAIMAGRHLIRTIQNWRPDVRSVTHAESAPVDRKARGVIVRGRAYIAVTAEDRDRTELVVLELSDLVNLDERPR